MLIIVTQGLGSIVAGEQFKEQTKIHKLKLIGFSLYGSAPTNSLANIRYSEIHRIKQIRHELIPYSEHTYTYVSDVFHILSEPGALL